MPKQKPYSVVVPFPFDGTWYQPPQTIHLSHQQALFLLKRGVITDVDETEANPNPKEEKAHDSAQRRRK